MPIPHTLTKLSQSLLLFGAHQTDASILPFESGTRGITDLIKNMAEFFASWRKIGATYDFAIDQSRTNYIRRGLNAPVEGFAGVPGPITTNITMTRSVLYLQDAMSAFGFLPGNIAFQTRPLILLEFNDLPLDPAGNNIFGASIARAGQGLNFDLNQSIPIIYTGCWISSSNIKYDIKGNDQAVIQSLTLNVSRVINPLSLIPPIGGVSAVQGLASNSAFLGSSGISRVRAAVNRTIGR